MYKDNISSQLLSDAIDAFSSLPGIGRKSAMRLALHLLKQPEEKVERFASAFIRMRREILHCERCNMISDSDKCPVCSDRSRDNSVVCVVESFRDVISIENTSQYRGVYHVLGGIISPMDGVGPSDLKIDSLIERVKEESSGIKEIILALSTGMEGETTSLYLYRKLASYNVMVSTIARGVGFGDDLEYTDEFTLGRSILNRQLYKPDNF